MESSPDYYGVLGVLPTAEEIVIRAAYRALALRYHPDQWKGDRRVAEQFMRQLNAAYEVLSNPERRKQYDKARDRNEYQRYEGDETAGAGFTTGEQAQSDAWKLALEYFPDLDGIFRRLQKTSTRLAISYRATLLELKGFGQRVELANELEARFLQSYFGKNGVITAFARQLIEEGNREAARELNRVVSVLGDGDPHAIISRIKTKYSFRAEREPLVKLARKVLEDRYVDDAVKLIECLGGDIQVRDLSWLPFGPSEKKVNCQNLSAVFETHDKMVDWIIVNIVPIVLKAHSTR